MPLSRSVIQIVVLTILMTLAGPVSSTVQGDPRQLAQLIEYISVDYPEAVQRHTAVNQDEYREMLEFSGFARK